MKDTDYSGVNTTVRILEAQLLSNEQLVALLRSASFDEAARLLQQTPYALDDVADIERVLMGELLRTYHRIAELVPDRRIVQLFSLQYTYHNLKVLLKERFVQQNFEHLLIDIGNYPLVALQTLVRTGEHLDLPEVMQEEVRSAIQYYSDYQKLEIIDIFMDNAYLRHLRLIAQQLNHPTIQLLVDALIDLVNLSCLVRGWKKDKSRSFLHLITSPEGALNVEELITHVMNDRFDEVLRLYAEMPYAAFCEPLLADATGQALATVSLEQLREQVTMAYLSQAQYEAFGPLPVLAYLCAKELEVRHLRLILVGKANQLPIEVLQERMRWTNGT